MPHAEGSGARIHYTDRGRGEPLLLLNGLSAPGKFWPMGLLERWSGRFRVLCVDHRGTGASERPAWPFTMADMARDAVAVLDHAGAERAVVIGLSMGGLVAQALALDHGHRVRGLVLMATGAGSLDLRVRPQLLVPLFVRRGSARDTVRALWSNITAPGFAQRDPAAFEEMERVVFAEPTPASVIRMQLLAVAGFHAAHRLGEVRAPALVLHGASDPLAPPDIGRDLARRIPGARFEVIAGAGHLLPWEAPAEVCERVETFMASLAQDERNNDVVM